MANNNSGNRQNRSGDNQDTTQDKVVQANQPTDTAPESTPAEKTEETDTQSGETQQKQVASDPVSVAETSAPVEEAPATDETATTTETVDEDPLVADLKELLKNFVEANQVYGTKPEDFVQSAKIAASITKYVIRNPKNQVLSALLDFFVEHKDDVCKGENFLKGVSKLSETDQQKIGYLYNLFSNLANGTAVRTESSQIIRVLDKQEFVTFYNRRLAVITQNNQS